MKNLIILALVAYIGLSATEPNDTKIGYVYMEQVMNNMPEAAEMMKTMQRFSAEKQELVEKQKNFIAYRTEDFEKKVASSELTSAGKIIAENEILSLNKDLELLKQRNEQEILTKRTQLLTPIAQRLEKAMDEVAQKMGYRYVLNSADGTGNSIVIVAPDADDLTKEVMAHLGIKLK